MSEVENKAATGRWVKILLAVSLGLNMLVLGAVGSMIYTHRGDQGMGPNMQEMRYGPYTRALSQDDRKEIGAALRREVGSFRQSMPKARETFRALLTALRAEEYDREVVHKLIAEQQALGLKRQQIGQRLLLERLDTMTPDARRDFAKRLQRALQQGIWARR